MLDGFARYVYDMGFEAVAWIFEYLALGAMIVLPIWIVVRLLRARSTPRDPAE